MMIRENNALCLSLKAGKLTDVDKERDMDIKEFT